MTEYDGATVWLPIPSVLESDGLGSDSFSGLISSDFINFSKLQQPNPYNGDKIHYLS